MEVKPFTELITLSTTRVSSIKIYRAKLLDDLVGTAIPMAPGKSLNVPFDIDDLEVADSVIAGDTSGKKTADVIRDASANNPLAGELNWQNGGNGVWLDRLRAFTIAFKRQVTTTINGVLMRPVSDYLYIHDVTAFTTIKAIRRGLDFNSIATLDISVIKLRESGLDLNTMPRENDVVEIKFRLPNAVDEQRVFIGFISGIASTEQAGQVTNVALECTGMAKWLFVNKMIVDRSIMSQFEEGELIRPGLSVTSTTFVNNTVDQIFTSLMTSQLAMKIKSNGIYVNVPGATGSSTRIAATRSLDVAALNTKLSQYQATEASLTKTLGNEADVVIDAINIPLTEPFTGEEPDTAVTNAHISAAEEPGILEGNENNDQLKAIANEICVDYHVFDHFLDNPFTTATKIQLAEVKIVLILLEGTKERFLKELDDAKATDLQTLKDTNGESGRAPDVKAHFVFDIDTFRAEEQFQLTYMPLITMALYRASFNDITAIYRGKQAFAFDTMLRSAFQMFFCSLTTPEDVLNSVRNRAKYAVYENELGQIVTEIPRYNDFGEDTLDIGAGEDINDFIINNPLSLTITREDMSMTARSDVQMFYPYLGPQGDVAGPAMTYHYTDPAVLVKYGMRAEAPIYNPNARDSYSASAFAALEVIDKNAKTRTMRITTDGSRLFKIGRVYFIRRTSLNRIMGGAPAEISSKQVPIKGFVGYLVGNEINVTAGQNIIHTLTFTYVRKATLVMRGTKVQANFKILPDLSGVIRALEQQTIQGNIDPTAYEEPQNTQAQLDTTAKILTRTDQGSMYVVPNEVIPWDTKYFRGKPNEPQDLPTGILETVPPFKTNQKYFSVLRLDNVGDGLSSGVVAALHLEDLKLRVFNRLIGTMELAEYRPSDLILKYNTFEAVFIPSADINPTFAFNAIRGFKFTFINPRQVNKTNPTGIIIQDRNATGGRTKMNAVDQSPGSIIAPGVSIVGKPIRIKGLQSQGVFTVLLINPKSLLQDVDILLAPDSGPNVVHNCTLYTYADLFGESAQNFKTSLFNTFNNVPHIQEQYAACEHSIEAKALGNSAAMIPIIWYPSDNLQHKVLDHANGVNTPLSVLYVAGRYDVLTQNKLPGAKQISATSTSDMNKEHAAGKAVDLTLVPWYATIGWVLKPHGSKHILQAEYNINSIEVTRILNTIKWGTMKKIPISTLCKDFLRVQIKPGAPNTGVNAIINAIITATNGGMVYADLPALDRDMYHVSEAQYARAVPVA